MTLVFHYLIKALLIMRCRSRGAGCQDGGRTRLSSIGIAILCATSLTSCSPGSDLPKLADTEVGPYQLSVGDQVRIIIFGAGQMGGQFLVNDQGNVAMPLLGDLRADGATTAELSHRIEGKLKESNILLDPSVSVEVAGYRPIFILGEVAKPGQYSYQPGMTVLTAVAIAGGFTYRAETKWAAMLRKVSGRSTEGRVTREMEVRPGDVITVEERYF